jgi:uncharacterized protein (DUF1800 family)
MPDLPRFDSRRRALQNTALWLGGLGLARSGMALPPGTPTEGNTTDLWRFMSRMGYGPTPHWLGQVPAGNELQDWAQHQLQEAVLASRQQARLEPALAEIRGPLPAIFEGVRTERSAREQLRSDARPEAPEGLRQLDFSGPTDPLFYNQTMVQKTAVWRLQSASLNAGEHPVLARMTEFWFNHFNVYIGKGAVRPFVGHYLLQAIRPNALGRFEDLLLATARHPAMLHYLDQVQSVAPGGRGGGNGRGLNENYAREVMELHTLGVQGGYTQTDVRELARVLTGWTVDPRAASGFRFAHLQHDAGSKTVLGQSYPSGFWNRGEAEGEAALRYLARQPQTARRISLRLARFFVADTPPAALVDQLSRNFMDTQGDLLSMVQTLLRSAEFWSPDNRLFKTPMDYACSALAATQGATQRRNLQMTLGFLSGNGQPLHGWQTPDGYPTDAATWLVPEALTRRADYALALGRQVPELDFLAPFLSAATRAALSQERPALRPGLALASPEFMVK